jgi:hypothetical protein
VEKQQEQANAYTTEEMQASLKRLRKKMTYIKDDMDVTSYAIRAIEAALNETLKEDKEANETNA